MEAIKFSEEVSMTSIQYHLNSHNKLSTGTKFSLKTMSTQVAEKNTHF